MLYKQLLTVGGYIFDFVYKFIETHHCHLAPVFNAGMGGTVSQDTGWSCCTQSPSVSFAKDSITQCPS